MFFKNTEGWEYLVILGFIPNFIGLGPLESTFPGGDVTAAILDVTAAILDVTVAILDVTAAILDVTAAILENLGLRPT